VEGRREAALERLLGTVTIAGVGSAEPSLRPV